MDSLNKSLSQVVNTVAEMDVAYKYSLGGAALLISSYMVVKEVLVTRDRLLKSMIKNGSCEGPDVIHHQRRQKTYPSPGVIFNGWYHFCDSDELKIGDVKEIKALGRVFVLWRTNEGKPVCQDAYCIHLGANLAVGGSIVDNCIQCPFHKWKFSEDGSVVDVPYAKNKEGKCSVHKKLQTYDVVDYCGLVMVYYHADYKSPEFQLPDYLPNLLKNEGWSPYMKWDIGFHTHNVIDWVDQAGDHSHFNTLHNSFVIPWTTLEIPKWIHSIFPIGIHHVVTTYRGDDQEWIDRVNDKREYWTGKHFMFFSDYASLTWNDNIIHASSSETMEIFLGPSNIIMNIPFTIGAFKVFFTMLPVEGGVILRARNWVDRRTIVNPFVRMISYILQGISASQLWSDIVIMDNKIRLTKPTLQPGDGPWRVSNTWRSIFYSESSEHAEKGCYKNDW